MTKMWHDSLALLICGLTFWAEGNKIKQLRNNLQFRTVARAETKRKCSTMIKARARRKYRVVIRAGTRRKFSFLLKEGTRR
jgi:hypothetical protein